MQKILKSLNQIDYQLFGTLLLFGFLPTIYTTVRIYFLGDMPMDWGFNIASQLAWVNVIYEVAQEGILLPVFYMLGKSLSDKASLDNKLKTGLIVTFSIYAIVSVFLITFITPLLAYMQQKPELIGDSATYIRFETIASMLNIMVQFLILGLITIKREKFLLYVLFAQMLLTILSDTFLISSLEISLKLGVIGIAYGNIGVNLILLIAIVSMLNKEGYFSYKFSNLNFAWIKEWGKVGGYSGLESFVRNFAFLVMVLKLVNEVGEQGTFWVANSFIWGWLLLPVLQLGQVVKRDCGEFGNKAIAQKTLGYFSLTSIIVLIWIISIPLWQGFIQHVLNIAEYEKVFNIALISLGFYILFAYNNVIDSIFYGIGKTQYMLFQSIVINTVFYGTLFVLYKLGIYQPRLNLIVVMFAGGISLDALLTFTIFKWMLKKRKIKLEF